MPTARGAGSGAWGRPAPGKRRRDRVRSSVRFGERRRRPLGDAHAGAPGDAPQLDRDERWLTDPAAEPSALVLSPAPGEGAARCDVLDPAAAFRAVGEPEPHDAVRLRLEPGVRTEPGRERRGVDHEPPDVLGRRLNDLLVDLGRHLASTLCGVAATVRLPNVSSSGTVGNQEVAIVNEGVPNMRASGVPTVVERSGT